MTSIATEHCYWAYARAMHLVRPRTDGRNGLTKRVVLLVDKSHLSNAREIGSNSALVGGNPNASRYALAALAADTEQATR